MISSSFSLSINIKSRVPVLLLLVILNGASKSYTISWLYQNLSSRVFKEILLLPLYQGDYSMVQ